MIISNNLKISKRTALPILKQKCTIKCDNCGNEFEKSYGATIKLRAKYGLDFCHSCNFQNQFKNGRQNNIVKYNASIKGKSWEERYGLEKSKVMKQKWTDIRKGKSTSLKGKSWDEVMGGEEANIRREKLRTHRKNKRWSDFTESTPKSRGISGKYKGINFRSTFELAFIMSNFNCISAENKEYRVKYVYEGEKRWYYPDFLIDGLIIEIKPKSLLNNPQNVAKFKAAKAKWLNSFVVLTEDDIEFPSLEQLQKEIEDGNIKLSSDENERLMKQKIWHS